MFRCWEVLQKLTSQTHSSHHLQVLGSFNLFYIFFFLPSCYQTSLESTSFISQAQARYVFIRTRFFLFASHTKVTEPCREAENSGYFLQSASSMQGVITYSGCSLHTSWVRPTCWFSGTYFQPSLYTHEDMVILQGFQGRMLL
jgi:hypothetical protein